MKLFGIVAIIAGIFLVTIYPSFKSDSFGEVLDSGTVYTRSQKQFKPINVALNIENNPLKIKLYGYFLPGGAYLDEDVTLIVRVEGNKGTIHSETIKPTKSDLVQTVAQDQVDSEARDDGSVILSRSTEAFLVQESGQYQVSVSSIEEIDFSLSLLDAVVLEKVSKPLIDLTIPGVALVVFGIILLHREWRKSRKRRRRNRKKRRRASSKPTLENTWEKQAELPTPEPPPKKQTHRWGRQKKKE